MEKSEYKKKLETKKELKESICLRYNLKKNQPLLFIYAPSNKSLEPIFLQLIEAAGAISCDCIVMADTKAPAEVQKRAVWLKKEESRKIEPAADMALLLEATEQQIQQIQNEGIVLIGYEKWPLLENYHPNKETGNSFTFPIFNPWAIFMALVRAHETYQFPYDWQHIVLEMIKKTSWKLSLNHAPGVGDQKF